MARTVAEAVASARGTLQDQDAQRASDAVLEGYARDAVNMIRNERPDLFIGNWGAVSVLTGSAALPLDDQYFRPVVDYMIARVETQDDEAVNTGRAELMAKLAGGFLS
jgi:hypothetical protein